MSDIVTVIADKLCSFDREFDDCSGYAKVIITALDAAGFVVVPKDPTREMLHAGITARTTGWGKDAVANAYKAMTTDYRAMLAAAKSPGDEPGRG